MRWLAAAMAGLALGALASSPAAAQAAPALDIRIERDPRPGVLSSDLVVNVRVIVTEHGTGAPPAENFEVFAYADNPGGEKTEIFPCGQESDNSPEVPRGIYLCTVIVDHGGGWTFHGAVNEYRADPDDPPVAVGQASVTLDIDTDEVALGSGEEEVTGSATDVVLLWGHSAAAGGWFVSVAMLAALALPGVRRRVSSFGLHRLEERLEFVVRVAWITTGVVVGTGTYLLLNLTAYETPFSSSAIDAVFGLPYGKPYFLALGSKLALYALMVAASVRLMREAQRQLRRGADAGTEAPGSAAAAGDVSPWGSGSRPGGGRGTGTAVAARPEVGSAAPGTVTWPEVRLPGALRFGWVVVAAGGLGISVCVTVLKYLHELIEATRAVL